MMMMFARRRMEAVKQHDANKAKAHEANHARVKAAQEKKPEQPKKKVVSDASYQPGAK